MKSRLGASQHMMGMGAGPRAPKHTARNVIRSYEGDCFFSIGLSFDNGLIAYNSWFIKRKRTQIMVKPNNYPSH